MARYPIVGLPAATAEAASIVEVSPATMSRWLRTQVPHSLPGISEVPPEQLRLLEAALYVRANNQKLDISTTGIHHWRRIRGGLYQEHGPEPWQDDALREHGGVIWLCVLRAACVAAVVRGEPVLRDIVERVPGVTDPWLQVLRSGPLATQGPTRSPRPPFHYVMEFDSVRVTAFVATRHRVVGLASAVAGEWPLMRIRLASDLDLWGHREGVVSVPVPAATRRLRYDVYEYPMVLRVVQADGRPEWWDIDESDYRSRRIPRLFGPNDGWG